MAALSQLPNVAVKMGGFGAYGDSPFSQEETTRYVCACIGLFGVDRAFFSSNLPVDLVDVPKPQARWETFFNSVAHHSAEDIAKFFYENARKFYRLPP